MFVGFRDKYEVCTRGKLKGAKAADTAFLNRNRIITWNSSWNVRALEISQHIYNDIFGFQHRRCCCYDYCSRNSLIHSIHPLLPVFFQKPINLIICIICIIAFLLQSVNSACKRFVERCYHYLWCFVCFRTNASQYL